MNPVPTQDIDLVVLGDNLVMEKMFISGETDGQIKIAARTYDSKYPYFEKTISPETARKLVDAIQLFLKRE